MERQRKTDYNIVYREKQKKPLTVSELFGKKEPAKKNIAEEVKKVEKQAAAQFGLQKEQLVKEKNVN